jgi:hypothetical protein
MTQNLITPDCPKCGASLWAVPCARCHPRSHYRCESCKREFVYDEIFQEWKRFNAKGAVAEIIPKRAVGMLGGGVGTDDWMASSASA